MAVSRVSVSYRYSSLPVLVGVSIAGRYHITCPGRIDMRIDMRASYTKKKKHGILLICVLGISVRRRQQEETVVVDNTVKKETVHGGKKNPIKTDVFRLSKLIVVKLFFEYLEIFFYHQCVGTAPALLPPTHINNNRFSSYLQ